MLISRKKILHRFRFFCKERTFTEFFLVRVFKTAIHKSGGTFFGSVKVFESGQINLSFSDFQRESFDTLANFFGRVVKTNFCVCIGLFQRKQNSEDYLSAFLDYSRKFFEWVFKTAFFASEGTSWAAFFWKEAFFHPFITLSGKLFCFEPKNHWLSAATAFYLPNGTFWNKRLPLKETIFFKFGLSAKSLGVLAENFQQVFKNLFLRPQRNVLKKMLLELKPSIYGFRYSSKKYRTFSEALLVGLPKLQPTILIDHFGEM